MSKDRSLTLTLEEMVLDLIGQIYARQISEIKRIVFIINTLILFIKYRQYF